ncbi:MAG: phenylalanine--tRNA ligase subunit beta [Gammaproteobacteria bacterium]|nr:phenylalanine--tRNA ligase subunit beta [Gammaproteobacteria bacterium]
MKFSEQWLREWVNPDISTDELSEQLTMAGLEVEAVQDCARDFHQVVVARVEQVKQHPQAEGLNICQLDIGDMNKLNVVCGADNVVPGNHYALAKVGANLADGRQIRSTEINGVTSAGMLCSPAELGLGEDTGLLLELASDTSPGADLQEVLCLDDHVIELSVTPNRGDCLSIAGIAREVAVLNGARLSPPDMQIDTATIENKRAITLQAAEACPCYVGRVVQGIDINRLSPTWLTEKLRRCGIRSINIVVDVTNYVMLELGQPMHAFDNDLLNGEISVRYARQGEKLQLLDGQSCNLTTQTLVIADESRAIAMAGIMGGLDTAVSKQTVNIFLESAFFSPRAILGRARDYGLHTDSSRRFERGVDYTLQRTALERASQLLLELCGGEAGPVVDICQSEHLPKRQAIVLKAENISRLLGIELDGKLVTEMLQRLGLTVTENETGSWQLIAPSFRFDIDIEADVIEEIARLYGYDKLPSTAMQSGLRMHPISGETQLHHLCQLLVSRGYYEAITYSFVAQQLQAKLFDAQKAVHLLNPISSDMGVMRQSLWPGLLMALQYNIKRQQLRVRLFEHGRVFNLDTTLRQESVISGIIYGKVYPEQWDINDISCDLYDIKSDVEALLGCSGQLSTVSYRNISHSALHPGQSIEILQENQVVGLMGSIHPAILTDLDIAQPTFVFELYLSRISGKSTVKFTKLTKFPSIRRDIAILVDDDVAVSDILKCIESCSSKWLDNLELFDVYQGEGIDIEKKSLALGLTFQRSSSTLVDEEVEGMMRNIIYTLHSEFGATLRE